LPRFVYEIAEGLLRGGASSMIASAIAVNLRTCSSDSLSTGFNCEKPGWRRAAGAAGFRLRPGGGRYAPAAIRYALLSALRSTFPARRPQTEAMGFRFQIHQPQLRIERWTVFVLPNWIIFSLLHGVSRD
jgi:hypothetical protein